MNRRSFFGSLSVVAAGAIGGSALVGHRLVARPGMVLYRMNAWMRTSEDPEWREISKLIELPEGQLPLNPQAVALDIHRLNYSASWSEVGDCSIEEARGT